MMRSNTTRLMVAGVAAALAAACADTPGSALTARTPSFSAGPTAKAEKTAGRQHPVAQSYTRSIDVDHKGGRIDIPEVGFRLTIPKNAIRANVGSVHMSVTVLSGNQVAYDFQPAGLTFDQPLQYEQDVRDFVKDATVDPSSVPQVSYFKSAADLDPATGSVRAYEDLPSAIDFSGHTLKADIWHFSGYIVSWSRR
jgi:hypothetical protein